MVQGRCLSLSPSLSASHCLCLSLSGLGFRVANSGRGGDSKRGGGGYPNMLVANSPLRIARPSTAGITYAPKDAMAEDQPSTGPMRVGSLISWKILAICLNVEPFATPVVRKSTWGLGCGVQARGRST